MKTPRALAFIPAVAIFSCLGCGKSAGSDVSLDVIEIINAIDIGNEARLKTLLENGALPTPDGSPLSPIHAAITHLADGSLVCDTKALRLLLDHGADPNFVDRDSGFAPLEDALSMGDRECVMLLRDAGASIDTHGASGQSLMQFAVKGVARSGDITLLSLVQSWGVSPNVGVGNVDGRSFTALHEAAWIVSPEMQETVVDELLRIGTDPCIRDRGQTALDIAENLKRSPVAQARLRSAMKACSMETTK